jgi:hypothetical protein
MENEKSRIVSAMRRNSRSELVSAKNACEIELQFGIIMRFKYYEYHPMSRRFEYRFVGDISGFKS